MRIVYLLACSKSKNRECVKDKTKKCEAQYMYTGTFFRYSLIYARAHTSDENIFILSAKHHMIALNKEIQWYDDKLEVTSSDDDNKSPNEMKEWGDYVHKQMEGEISDGNILFSFDMQDTKFLFLTGPSYAASLLGMNTIKMKTQNNRQYSNALYRDVLQGYDDLSGQYVIPNGYRTQGGRVKWLRNRYLNASAVMEGSALRTVTNEQPGWYRIYSTRAALENLLHLNSSNKEYLDKMFSKYANEPYSASKWDFKKVNQVEFNFVDTDADRYYCIYIGEATNESMQSGLAKFFKNKDSGLWHILTKMALRFQYVESETYDFMRSLVVKYSIFFDEIGSKGATKKIKDECKKEFDMTINMIPYGIISDLLNTCVN